MISLMDMRGALERSAIGKPLFVAFPIGGDEIDAVIVLVIDGDKEHDGLVA